MTLNETGVTVGVTVTLHETVVRRAKATLGDGGKFDTLSSGRQTFAAERREGFEGALPIG